MKKKLMAGLATGLLLMGISGISSAATIDFEGVPTYTTITNQYQSLGVNFINMGWAATWDGNSKGNPGNWGLEGTNGSAFYGIQANSVIALSFDHIISQFALDTSRSEGSDATNTFTLTAFLGNSQVGSKTITQGDINSWTNVSLSGLSFDQVQLTSDNGFRPVYGIDNIVYGSTPTPEPATMLLLGSGLAGLIGARRKKKDQA